MSPNVGNFVHDLVEMAKAMETLPQVQAELERANTQIEQYAKQVQEREIAIIDYKAKIEELQSKVRATEAERDDAELRFLDLEEKVHLVIGTLSHVGELVGDVESKLTPPKPQPEPVVEAQPQSSGLGQPQGQGESPPISSSTSMEHPAEVSGGGLETPQPQANQDQSEVNPTNPATEPMTSVSSNDAKNSDAGNTAKPSGPYTSKLYYDHPVYVTLWDWLDGGGTEENYRWSPNYNPTSG